MRPFLRVALFVGRINMKFWLETNPTIDEYANSTATGIFTASGWCIVGVEHCWRPNSKFGRFWRFGLIVFNIGFGVWSG